MQLSYLTAYLDERFRLKWASSCICSGETATCNQNAVYPQGFHYFSCLPVLQYLQAVLFLLKYEQFSWISCTTLFKIRRYHLRPFQEGKCTWYRPLLKWLISSYKYSVLMGLFCSMSTEIYSPKFYDSKACSLTNGNLVYGRL